MLTIKVIKEKRKYTMKLQKKKNIYSELFICISNRAKATWSDNNPVATAVLFLPVV